MKSQCELKAGADRVRLAVGDMFVPGIRSIYWKCARANRDKNVLNSAKWLPLVMRTFGIPGL